MAVPGKKFHPRRPPGSGLWALGAWTVDRPNCTTHPPGSLMVCCTPRNRSSSTSPSTILATWPPRRYPQEKGVFLQSSIVAQSRHHIRLRSTSCLQHVIIRVHPRQMVFPFGRFISYPPLTPSAYLQFEQFAHPKTRRYPHLLNRADRTLRIMDTIGHDRFMPHPLYARFCIVSTSSVQFTTIDIA